MAAKWRKMSANVPDYYLAPLYRPGHLNPIARAIWDADDNWITAAEWLAMKRRAGNYHLCWNGKRWHGELRPIIQAHRLGVWASTRKIGRLP
jgi:hypothetical protein